MKEKRQEKEDSKNTRTINVESGALSAAQRCPTDRLWG